MKPIIKPVPKDILEQELTAEKFVRKTNLGNNEIYIVDYHDSPNIITEIGRLREVSFRDAGGGTGKEIDIDDFDTMENAYKQLIVWDPEIKEILGGYRFHDCKEVTFDNNGQPMLATTELFTFSEKFIKDYLPYTLELGRSFVQPIYQASKASRKSLYTLDNLWNGIGAVYDRNPHLKYFFGKVTMYPHFNQKARDMILYFMKKYFGDPENLVYPNEHIEITTPESELAALFTENIYNKDYRILSHKVRELGENIPPLVNSYMNLSSTMKVFGTGINHHFGLVEETGILVTITDIHDNKRNRHIAGS